MPHAAVSLTARCQQVRIGEKKQDLRWKQEPVTLTSLPVVRGGVAPLLCAVGGLLMTVTAGGCCVDVAVSAAQDPVNLKRLSNALLGLVGLGFHGHVSYRDDMVHGGGVHL